MAAGKPLTPRQKRRIAAAVDRAERSCGLQFCVYVGPTEDDPRAHALRTLADLGYDPGVAAVLVLVAPMVGRFELVTSAAAHRRISERDLALVATAMCASFGVGDITGGITEAVRLLAQAAGPGIESGAELPDLLDTG